MPLFSKTKVSDIKKNDTKDAKESKKTSFKLKFSGKKSDNTSDAKTKESKTMDSEGGVPDPAPGKPASPEVLDRSTFRKAKTQSWTNPISPSAKIPDALMVTGVPVEALNESANVPAERREILEDIPGQPTSQFHVQNGSVQNLTAHQVGSAHSEGLLDQAEGANSVLIIGAGPCGCLLAAELRKRNPGIDLSIWEAAKGTGGRQASRRFDINDGQTVTVDMGAQVMTIDSKDPTACAEMESLCQAALMRPAMGLSMNEERPSDPGIHHFWSTQGGLSKVYRTYLANAKPNHLHFGRRVTSIDQGSDHKKWRVIGVDGSVSDPHGNHEIHSQVREEFDAVLMTGTSWDAQQVLKSCGGVNMDWYLKTIEYDTRVTIGLVMSPQVSEHVDAFLQGASEKLINDGVIHYIADQRPKMGNASGCVPLVLHTTDQFSRHILNAKGAMGGGGQGGNARFRLPWNKKPGQAYDDGDVGRANILDAVLQKLASYLGLQTSDLHGCVMDFDMIHWVQCQSKPEYGGVQDMEPSMMAFPGCALASSSPPLILCGDYLAPAANGGFTKCLRTVKAGANALQNSMKSKQKSILVVGAGAVGCMTAAKLRKQMPQAKISVWECARGTGGRVTSHRFGPETENAVADMGAQVMSFNLSHQAVADDVYVLAGEGLLQRATGLSWTEERELSQGMPFVHYWATEGTSSVFRRYLDAAHPDELTYGRRVVSIAPSTGKPGWSVTAVDGSVSDPHGEFNIKNRLSEEFDSVIITTPSWDACQIDGVNTLMDTETHNALTAVEYDRRTCIAFCLRPEMTSILDQCFGSSSERVVDDGVVHLVANQNAKRQQNWPVIVVHCARTYHPNNDVTAINASIESLARCSNCSPQLLASAIHDVKVINWKQCQMVSKSTPTSSVFTTFPGCAVVSANPPLLLAGDYLTHSGCTGAMQAAIAASAGAARLMAPTSIPRSPTLTDQSILIIGGGPTGCMVAAKLRKLFPSLSITLWECARGPGGRFAAAHFDLGEGNIMMDMGAQVQSCNMTDDLVRMEVTPLVEKGLMSRCYSLSSTEERSKESSHLTHHWARNGTTSILHHYLSAAKLDELRFGRRVIKIEHAAGSKHWSVTAADGDVSDPHQAHNVESTEARIFQGVIFAGTAWDAMNTPGLPQILTEEKRQAMKQVEYDQRCSVGLCFHPEFRERLDTIFAGATELVGSDGTVHLMAYQDAKRQGTNAVVVHTTREYAQRIHQEMPKMTQAGQNQVLFTVIQHVAKMWNMTPHQLSQNLRASKVICWRQCSLSRGYPKHLMGKFPGCLVASSSPPFVLAGDYFTGGSFTGVVHAATAAAYTVDHLIKVPQLDDRSNTAQSVLVIGAGITGAVAAAKIRAQFPAAHIQVWEAAAGTGGRVARRGFNNENQEKAAIADMGGQVMSVDTNDPEIAQDIHMLSTAGLINRAHALTQTEERNNELHHYWARGGITSVLHHYLQKAHVDHLCFKRRVTSLLPQGSGGWQVMADVGEVGDPYEPGKAHGSVVEHFNAVVVALPAWETLKLGGMQSVLPGPLVDGLRNVTYDSRYAVGLSFLPYFKKDVEAWLANRAEVTVDDNVLHLVAYQGAKREDEMCVLVCHTTRQYRTTGTTNQTFRECVLQAVLTSLAHQMNISVAALKIPLHSHKVIDWKDCQCTSVLQGASGGCALIQGPSPLILAGDYFAPASFGAVFKSACSAAVALRSQLSPEGSVPRALAYSVVAPRVLIVGAGASGSVLASQLRRQFGNRIPHLAVWDCAKGAAGRMATRRFPAGPSNIILDMGAQVITIDQNNYAAVQESQYLVQKGIVHKAHGLSNTEERPHSPSITNYWARNGTTDILRNYLDEARPEDLRFGRRVLNIEQNGGNFLVTAGDGEVSDPHGQNHVSGTIQEEFHCVIATGTAWDIMSINGMQNLLPFEIKQGLSSVQYDRRWSIGFSFHSWMKPVVETYFAQAAEVVIEDDLIHFLAYQGAKREQANPAIVVHTARRFSGSKVEEVLPAVKNRITHLLGIEAAQFEMGLHAVDQILWWECQSMATSSPPGALIAGRAPALLVAGDFLNGGGDQGFQGIFTGALKTAQAVGQCLNLTPKSDAWVSGPGFSEAKKQRPGRKFGRSALVQREAGFDGTGAPQMPLQSTPSTAQFQSAPSAPWDFNIAARPAPNTNSYAPIVPPVPPQPQLAVHPSSLHTSSSVTPPTSWHNLPSQQYGTPPQTSPWTLTTSPHGAGISPPTSPWALGQAGSANSPVASWSKVPAQEWNQASQSVWQPGSGGQQGWSISGS
jgi:predicted NAD/FAD-dependent oxidoreductase